MKKTSKLFGAVALSAALALGTAVPAFADPTFNDDQIGVDGSNKVQTATMDAGTTSGNTNVFLKTTTTQINATIPLDIVVTANVEGGAMVTPSKEAYKISNNNEKANLYVKSATATLEGTSNEWKSAMDKTWPAAAVATKDNNATKGSILMRVDPSASINGTDTTWDPVLLIATESTVTNGSSTYKKTIDSDKKWIVPAATDASTPGVLNLQLVGANSEINGLKADNTTIEKIMTVTYTVTANPTDAS